MSDTYPIRQPPRLPDAACAGHDTDRWYPDSQHHSRVPGPGGQATRDALAICKSCPERAPCLAYAVEHGEHGIWGGLEEADRRRLKARSQEQALRERRRQEKTA